jgi:integrase
LNDLLGRDNARLSRPRIAPEEIAFSSRMDIVSTASFEPRHAIDCSSSLAEDVETYVRAGVAPATRRAYRADLDHFRAWGGEIPTTDGQLAAYLAAHATSLSVATLTRRLAAIAVAHRVLGQPSPITSPLVRATLPGIRRSRGVAQRHAKPLLRDDLFAVLAAMGESLKDVRDQALLLIGFAGAFRRSELCSIDCADVEHVRQGVMPTCTDRRPIRMQRVAKSAFHLAAQDGVQSPRSTVGLPRPRSMRVRYSDPWTDMGEYWHNGSHRRPSAWLSRGALQRRASTHRAIPATAFAPASPPAPPGWGRLLAYSPTDRARQRRHARSLHPPGRVVRRQRRRRASVM